MNKILLKDENSQAIVIMDATGNFKKIKEIDKLFHGKVTIHFANGTAKKIEVNKVEDIVMST